MPKQVTNYFPLKLPTFVTNHFRYKILTPGVPLKLALSVRKYFKTKYLCWDWLGCAVSTLHYPKSGSRVVLQLLYTEHHVFPLLQYTASPAAQNDTFAVS